MAVTCPPYDHRVDHQKGDCLLLDVYRPSDQLLDWLQPHWK